MLFNVMFIYLLIQSISVYFIDLIFWKYNIIPLLALKKICYNLGALKDIWIWINYNLHIKIT